jgi:hypothetical protein
MNFRCGPACVQVKRSRFLGNRVTSLRGKRFDIAILPANVQSCYDWHTHYIGQEIAVQRPKLQYCTQSGGAYGVTCSTIVSRQFNDWHRPDGGKISKLPSGQYLICASVDANNNGYQDEDEFFSETRVNVNPIQEQYYPVQNTTYNGQYPYNNGQYPNNQYSGQYPYSSQAIDLAPASRFWDGGSPIYY